MDSRESVIIELSLDDYNEGRVVMHFNYLRGLKKVCKTNFQNIAIHGKTANYFPICFMEDATIEEVTEMSKAHREILENLLKINGED